MAACTVSYPWVAIGKDRLNLKEAEADPSAANRFYWSDDTVVDFYERG